MKSESRGPVHFSLAALLRSAVGGISALLTRGDLIGVICRRFPTVAVPLPSLVPSMRLLRRRSYGQRPELSLRRDTKTWTESRTDGSTTDAAVTQAESGRSRHRDVISPSWVVETTAVSEDSHCRAWDTPSA